jgi:hypothetical protein
MGYRYCTDPIQLTQESADLTVACALVAQVPEVPEGSLNVDFTGWKSAHQYVHFLFALKAACGDAESQTIRVEGESDDDVEYPTYELGNYDAGSLARLVEAAWGAQPERASRTPFSTGFAGQSTTLKEDDVEAALRNLNVRFALGELPREDYGHLTPSLVVSRLRRFDFQNPRLRGNTLEETYDARRALLARHGIQLTEGLARHICLASADPYRR